MFTIKKNVGKVRYDIINLVLTWHLCRYRINKSNIKNISNIQGSTRKIYKQKGLGKARHGSMRATQFRGGSSLFGPNNRIYSFNINKKIIKTSLIHAILIKFYTNSIKIIKKYHCVSKTKYYLKYFKEKKILFIDNIFQDNFVKASKNIFNIRLSKIINLNTINILRSRYLYISKHSLNYILNVLLNE